MSLFTLRGDARLRAVTLLHPSAHAFNVAVPSRTADELRRQGANQGAIISVSGYFATLTIVGGRMLLYRGGAQPHLVADLVVESIDEDLVDNGQGTWLPAIVVTASDGVARLGFYPRKAGLIPDAAKVRGIVAALRDS